MSRGVVGPIPRHCSLETFTAYGTRGMLEPLKVH